MMQQYGDSRLEPVATVHLEGAGVRQTPRHSLLPHVQAFSVIGFHAWHLLGHGLVLLLQILQKYMETSFRITTEIYIYFSISF